MQTFGCRGIKSHPHFLFRDIIGDYFAGRSSCSSIALADRAGVLRGDRISPHRQPLTEHGNSTEHYNHMALCNVRREPLRHKYIDRITLDGVYVERPDDSLRFRRVKALIGPELTQLMQTVALRIGYFL